MEPVSLRLCVLYLNRKTHHHGAAESDGPVNKFNSTELDIANTAKTTLVRTVGDQIVD